MKLPLLAALALLVAPAAFAESGQRLAITAAAGVKAPDAQAIVHSLLGEPAAAAGKRSVQVRLLRDGSGSTLQIDVHGATLPTDSAERVKSMFPELRNAQIQLVPIDAPPAGLEGVNPDADPAALKAQIEEKLAAEGKRGTVEVQTSRDADGAKQVRVEVKVEK